MKAFLSILIVLAVSLGALLVACGSDGTATPTGGGVDAGSFDAASFDAAAFDAVSFDAGSTDGGGPPDASPPADAGATYNDMTTAAFWSAFDTTTVNADAKGFEGSVFDGRYIYFFPYTGGATGIVARYDTQAGFSAKTSWSTFDTQTVDANATGFAGGAFDGRYVYLAPRHGLGNIVSDLLQKAGYERPSFERFDAPICMGRTLDDGERIVAPSSVWIVTAVARASEA